MSALSELRRDVPARYRALVARCTELAGELGVPELADEALRSISSAIGPVRVGLLGQQATKSPIVNALLGVDALDEVYGQGRIRRVSASEVEGIALKLGEDMKVPLDSGGWARVEDLPSSVDVEVGVDNDLLRRLGVELVDFPMSRRLRAGGEEWRGLQRCHLVILIVHAPSMITRTEADVLRDLGARAGPPCAAVIVTAIASVAEEERAAVNAGIERVVQRTAGAAELVVISDPAATGDEVERVLSKATQQVRAGGGRDWQLEAFLRALLLDLTTLAEERIRLRALAGPERKRQIDGLEQRHKDALDALAEIRDSVRGRTSVAMDALKRHAAEARREATRQLLVEFDHAVDLSTWWTDELPELIEETVTHAIAGLEERIGAVVGDQLAWAQHELEQAGVDTQHEIDLPPPPGLNVPALLLPATKSDQLRVFVRLSQATLRVLGPVLGALLAVPVPGLDQLPDAIFGGRIKADTDRARQLLRTKVREAVDGAYEEGRVRAESSVTELMATLRDDMTRRYETKRDSLRAALADEAASDDHVLTELDSAMTTLMQSRSVQ